MVSIGTLLISVYTCMQPKKNKEYSCTKLTGCNNLFLNAGIDFKYFLKMSEGCNNVLHIDYNRTLLKY